MMRVLVVDEDPALRRTLKRDLKRRGFTVGCAGTFEQGLALAVTDPVDLVIADANVIERHGLDLLTELRERTRSTFAVITSSHREALATHHAFVAHLGKPFTSGELLDAIARARAAHQGASDRRSDNPVDRLRLTLEWLDFLEQFGFDA